MSESARMVPSLHVSTRPLDDPGNLLRQTLRDQPLAFVRRGDGIIGIGEAFRRTFHGPSRMRDAAELWRTVAAAAVVDDQVDVRGSGLIAFGAFTFDDDSAADSVLIVPRVVIGRRHGRSWLTAIDTVAVAEQFELPSTTLPDPPIGAHVHVAFHDGHTDAARYGNAVSEAVALIASGAAEKIVLARDRIGTMPTDADLRSTLTELADAYPDCVTFAVDGLFGATPETLARTSGRALTARVLAGSAARGTDPASDRAAAETLANSSKDVNEHAFALASLIEALQPIADNIHANATPFRLQLPNLWHLASDITATLPEAVTSLDVADTLHPTAAVAGTPTDVAVHLIKRIEGADRGRYAGPVGWMGASGDGEWMLALRSAQVTGTTVTAWAGAGIVAASVPEQEIAETALKFRPVTGTMADPSQN